MSVVKKTEFRARLLHETKDCEGDVRAGVMS